MLCWYFFTTLLCSSAKQGATFFRSDWPCSQHRRTSLTSAGLTDGMQICRFISLPFFALTPWDSQQGLMIGWWEITRTEREWCKSQINYCNSTTRDLFLNMSFQNYHTFQNLQEKFCNIIKRKSSMQTHPVLLC